MNKEVEYNLTSVLLGLRTSFLLLHSKHKPTQPNKHKQPNYQTTKQRNNQPANQPNKQTNKRKTKQNKAKPKNTVKAQGVSYLARKDKTTSLFLLLLFIIVHIFCFALNVNKMEKKH